MTNLRQHTTGHTVSEWSVVPQGHLNPSLFRISTLVQTPVDSIMISSG